MKRFLVFFVLLVLVNCASNDNKNTKSDIFLCPNIYFSSEHKSYIKSEDSSLEISFENISFKASLNNFIFNKKCSETNSVKSYPLDILILIEPFNPKFDQIEIPLFAFLYDENDNILDRQYFKVNGSINYNEESKIYSFTELSDRITIISDLDSLVTSIVIGFIKID